MTILEAKKILRHFYSLSNPTEEEEFLYTEALQFLIAETKDSDYMVDLGGFYYDKREFDLALKYYEMAAEYGNRYAISNLGYIWYYGRTGEKDYEKAFKYFDKARAMGDIVASYKVADMYRNGYYVEKDYEKYKEIILSLYPKVKNARRLGEPLPEIFTRLAKIRSDEGKTEEALSLYDTARDFLAQRIRANPFFGNLTIMKWLIHDVYELREFDPAAMDLHDLYHV
ncbi:MAG: sel1 repeat family protein, partial [Lachnospiraceae bacterium]|nr:sel1 repeat family protein [Lachnospiraceae bacterium]